MSFLDENTTSPALVIDDAYDYTTWLADTTNTASRSALAGLTATQTPPVVDTTALVKDPVDGTKRVRIDAGTVATLTTRTITMPDSDVNLADGVAAKVVTDKFNITAQTAGQHLVGDGTDFVNKAFYYPIVVTLTDAADIATDASLGNIFKVTLTASRNMSAPSNPVDGQFLSYRITQGGTGSYAITWNAVFDFGGAGSPTLTTTVGQTDYVSFRYNLDKTQWDYMGTALSY